MQFAAISLSAFGLIAAFAAGAVSFLSPCFLPLVPGYIAFIAGDDAETRVRKVAFFVTGFTIVFTLLGLGSAALGGTLVNNRNLLDVIGGSIIIAFGLLMLSPRVPFFLAGEHKLHVNNPTSYAASVGFGMAFAIGWSPCIGPTLGAVLTLAAANGAALEGAVLLATFSLGLGLPILLVALSLDRFKLFSDAVRNHVRAIRVVSGAFMVLFGVLLATGVISELSAQFGSSYGIAI